MSDLEGCDDAQFGGALESVMAMQVHTGIHPVCHSGVPAWAWFAQSPCPWAYSVCGYSGRYELPLI